MGIWFAILLGTFFGLLGVAYLIWRLFLLGQSPAKAHVTPEGVQQIQVEVRNGYCPRVIEAESGRWLRLRFYRIENSPCSEELILQDFGVRELLPAYQTTTVDILPFQPGVYDFTCGNQFLKGRLIIQ